MEAAAQLEQVTCEPHLEALGERLPAATVVPLLAGAACGDAASLGLALGRRLSPTAAAALVRGLLAAPGVAMGCATQLAEQLVGEPPACVAAAAETPARPLCLDATFGTAALGTTATPPLETLTLSCFRATAVGILQYSIQF